MAVFSGSQDPESVRMVRDLEVLADEFEGRFLLGKVDVDTAPSSPRRSRSRPSRSSRSSSRAG